MHLWAGARKIIDGERRGDLTRRSIDAIDVETETFECVAITGAVDSAIPIGWARDLVG